jgi:hypothetical protein
VDTASTSNIIVFIWSDVTDTTAGDFLYITNVQLEKGTQATSFEYRQYTTELALCQRYFEKLGVGVGISSPGIGGASVAANWNFKVTKRVAATMTGFSATDSQVGGTDTAYCQSTNAAATWAVGATASAEL